MLDEILLIPFSVILFQRKKNKCKTLNMLNIDFNFYLILFMNIFNYRWNRIFSKFFWKHKYRCWTAFSGLLFWIVCLCRLVSVQFLLVKDIRINKYDDDCDADCIFSFGCYLIALHIMQSNFLTGISWILWQKRWLIPLSKFVLACLCHFYDIRHFILKFSNM